MITAKRADYLLTLKDNWPTLAAEVRLSFAAEPANGLKTYEVTEGDHGRIEIRPHRVSHDVGWRASVRRFSG